MEVNSTKLPQSLSARAIALMLATIGCLAATAFASEYGANRVMAVLAALSLALFLAASWTAFLMIRDAGIESAYAVGRTAWAVLVLLFWCIAAGLAFFAVGFGLTQAAPVAAPLFLYFLAFIAVVIIAMASASDAVRRRRYTAILTYLDKAMRLNLPLNRIIAAAAQGERGVLRERLLSLQDHLDRGQRLETALGLAVPEMPLEALRAIAAAERLDQLPHLMERWFRRGQREDQPFTHSVGLYQGYPVVLGACVIIICIVALPKFESLLVQFKLHIPWTARLLTGIEPNDTPLLAIVLILVILAPLGRALSRMFPATQTSPPFGGAMKDQILWWVPLVHGYVRDRAMADTCDMLCAGIEAGRPLDECLRECADGQGNAVLRYRLRAWAGAVERGQKISDAARYARLPGLFVRFLATVRADEDLGQVLQFLARHYESSFERKRAMLRAMYVPVVVVAMGILVALVGLALFQPMILLIDNLAAKAMRGL